MNYVACNFIFIMILYIPVQEEFLTGSSSLDQTADFFRGDNREGVEARNEVSELLLLLQYLKVNNNKTICYEFVPNVVHILKRGLFENSGGILYGFSWNIYILLF